jgi:fumarate reductase subunit C
MTQNTRVTRRKPYVRSMRGRWWARNNHFKLYMLREGTSVFLGLYATVLLFGILALDQGEAGYVRWLAALASPLFILFHALVFVAACYHTCTWFAVSPKTMPPLRFRGKAVTSGQIIVGQYVVLAITSLVIVISVGSGATSTSP